MRGETTQSTCFLFLQSSKQKMSSNDKGTLIQEIDNDFVTLEPENAIAVRFTSSETHCKPRDDIFVVYELCNGYKPSSRDWIGLYTGKYHVDTINCHIIACITSQERCIGGIHSCLYVAQLKICCNKKGKKLWTMVCCWGHWRPLFCTFDNSL